ncbi:MULTISPECIES: SDR family NAD(P)-dependent oxidoreductase [unclassified Streptosporangium]|uniref:SDR family NAD(P)-dependent oxidoreductase n=1 Tax=unclassified Streptosporangium TaxID=2632669 RepID=UPI002E27CAC1|nr:MULTISPECIES: SDR family oxidoreductase [unclassified Streptosporangium]
MTDLSGMIAVVTGGSSGIGEATVRRLIADGAYVVSGDLMRAADHPPELHHVDLDLTDPEAGTTLVGATLDRFGRLDILVNNVGIAPTRPSFVGTTDDDWATTWSVNVMSAVRVSRAALPSLKASQRGSVVFVASTTGRTPDPYFVDYAVTKAGLVTLAKTLAEEFGPHGVRINSVSPGSIRTPLWDQPGGFVDDLSARLGLPREEAVQKFVRSERRISLGRPGHAAEVASAISFLVSDDASYITGIDLVVDGGSTKSV